MGLEVSSGFKIRHTFRFASLITENKEKKGSFADVLHS